MSAENSAVDDCTMTDSMPADGHKADETSRPSTESTSAVSVDHPSQQQQQQQHYQPSPMTDSNSPSASRPYSLIRTDELRYTIVDNSSYQPPVTPPPPPPALGTVAYLPPPLSSPEFYGFEPLPVRTADATACAYSPGGCAFAPGVCSYGPGAPAYYRPGPIAGAYGLEEHGYSGGGGGGGDDGSRSGSESPESTKSEAAAAAAWHESATSIALGSEMWLQAAGMRPQQAMPEGEERSGQQQQQEQQQQQDESEGHEQPGEPQPGTSRWMYEEDARREQEEMQMAASALLMLPHGPMFRERLSASEAMAMDNPLSPTRRRQKSYVPLSGAHFGHAASSPVAAWVQHQQQQQQQQPQSSQTPTSSSSLLGGGSPSASSSAASSPPQRPPRLQRPQRLATPPPSPSTTRFRRTREREEWAVVSPLWQMWQLRQTRTSSPDSISEELAEECRQSGDSQRN